MGVPVSADSGGELAVVTVAVRQPPDRPCALNWVQAVPFTTRAIGRCPDRRR